MKCSKLSTEKLDYVKNKLLFTFPYIILFDFFVFLLWRSQYGFIWSDEPYYFETAYRFIQGDIPIVNDWYTSQIYSVLLVPFVCLWKLIFSNDFTGLFLVTRYIYVFMQFIVAVICYHVLKKRSSGAALVSAILFMVYCRANIGTLSYYSVASAVILLSLLGLYHSRPKCRYKIVKYLAVGIMWGVAIVCNPYLLLLFLPVFFLMCLKTVQKKRDSYDIKSLIALFCGTAFVAIYFIGYIFYQGASIGSIVKSINYIMSDQAYYGSGGVFKRLVYSVAYVAYHFRYTIVFSAACAGYLLIQYIRKNQLSGRKIRTLFIINTVILVIDILYPAVNVFTVGSAMAAMTIWGWQIFFLTEKKDWEIFWLFYVVGCVVAMLMGASSDTHFSAMTQGFMIAAVGTAMLLEQFKVEIIHQWRLEVTKKSLYRYLLFSSVLLVLIYSLYSRIFLVYRDRPLDQLKVRIEEGPGKGIYTTSECAERYNVISSVVMQLSGLSGNLYIMGFCPWGYLYTEMRCSPYTTWRISPEAEDELGKSYYIEHSEKFPDIVLRLSYDYIEYTDETITKDADAAEIQRDNLNRKIMNEKWNDTGLVQELEKGNYRKIEVKCGTLYIKNNDRYQNINRKLFNE